jgi:4-aminobutyrate aminotransferase
LYRALGRGLSFKISLGNVLTLSPPLIVREPELDAALEILETCIAEIERERFQA